MPTAALTRKLTKLLDDLNERYSLSRPPLFESFIESMIYQILVLGTSDRSARKALTALREEFVDYNDMRVGSIREIQDILGPRYQDVRIKAEDLHHLLADFYTAFRKTELDEYIRTPEGMETLRALPETTLVRADMVEWSLCWFYQASDFIPWDTTQYELLQFLGVVPAKMERDEFEQEIRENLDINDRILIGLGLREHLYMLEEYSVDGFQNLNFKGKKRRNRDDGKINTFVPPEKYVSSIFTSEPAEADLEDDEDENDNNKEGSEDEIEVKVDENGDPIIDLDAELAKIAAAKEKEETEEEKKKPAAKKPAAKKPAVKKAATETKEKEAAKSTAKKPVAKKATTAAKTTTAAKKPAAKKTTTTAAKKPAAKKTTTAAAKKPAAKKTTTAAAKKPAAKKTTTTAAKKPAAKTTAAKKPAAKTTAAKKPAAKSTTTKKTTTAKKPAAKTTAAKKPAAKKAPAKKAATKK